MVLRIPMSNRIDSLYGYVKETLRLTFKYYFANSLSERSSHSSYQSKKLSLSVISKQGSG